MLVYKSAYKWEGGVCLCEVLDFPGTVSFGNTLDEARANLAGSLPATPLCDRNVSIDRRTSRLS